MAIGSGIGSAIGTGAEKIAVRYQADTSQMKREIRGLRGEQKKHKQEALKAAEEQNRAIEGQIGQWQKLAVAVAAVGAAVEVGRRVWQAYAEDVRLSSATAGADVDRLQDSLGGLIDQTETMRHAAALMNGTFELTQREMETVFRAAVQLRNETGQELPRVLERLTKAINEGATDPLKELGIVMKETTGEAETVDKILAELGVTAQKAGEDTGLATDEMERGWVRVKDAISDLQVSGGELVNQLGPSVMDFATETAEAITVLAHSVQGLKMGFDSLADSIPEIPQWAKDAAELIPTGTDMATAPLQILRMAGQPESLFFGGGSGSGSAPRLPSAHGRDPDTQIGRVISDAEASIMGVTVESINAQISAAAREALGSREFRAGEPLGPAREISALDRLGGVEGLQRSIAEDTAGDSIAAAAERTAESLRRVNEEAEAAHALARDRGLLESVLGPADQFNVYADGFAMLESVAGSAFNSWITGSKTAGEAFQSMLRDLATSLAQEMFMQSLKHGAYAVGALALGRPELASTHGVAAAQFAAGAAVAGGVARTMHTAPTASGGSAGSRPSSRSRSRRGRDTTDAGPQIVHVFVGSEFADESPRVQRARVVRAADAGRRELSGAVRHE